MDLLREVSDLDTVALESVKKNFIYKLQYSPYCVGYGKGPMIIDTLTIGDSLGSEADC